MNPRRSRGHLPFGSFKRPAPVQKVVPDRPLLHPVSTSEVPTRILSFNELPESVQLADRQSRARYGDKD
jgi:hypothetical protein